MRITCFVFGLSLLLGSCTQRTICPAYQSAFIHDKEALSARFSYFNEDSTPKIRDVDKSRFLIVEPVAYKKRTREMRTVVMQDIYPVPEEDFDQDLMLAERDVIDTTQLTASIRDSIHPGLIGPFNVEQELYMYYLEDILLLPDTRAEMEIKYEREKKNKGKKKEIEEEAVEEEEEKEKRGPFSIFKKKDKDNEDPEENDTEDEEAPDPEEESPPTPPEDEDDTGDGEDDF